MKKRQGRYTAAFAILLVLVLVFLVLNVCIGSVNIPVTEIPKILFGNGADDVYTDIVMGIRFPRALAAAILGGGLALSGYLLQTFFHNPIAGPFTLGISSGAKLMVSLVMVASLGNALKLSSWLMIIAAFVGAMICMGFVILMSRVMDQMSMLIVSGVMIGYICSAITDFIVTFADDADIVNLHNWSKGSFSGITWNNVSIMAIVTGVTLIGIFLLSIPLVPIQWGEPSGAFIQRIICLRDGICRSCILRWNCGSSSGKESVWNGKTHSYDSCLLSGGRDILSFLRFAGENHVCPYRVVHQYSDGSIRCSGGDLYYDSPEEREGGVGSWKNFIFIPKD